MRFVPRFTDGQEFFQSLGNIVCIGCNYADQAKELNNPVLTELLRSTAASVRTAMTGWSYSITLRAMANSLASA